MKAMVEKDRRESVPVRRDESYLLPLANIIEKRDEFVIEAEMPGVNRSGLEITLEEHTLTLVGWRDTVMPPGQALYIESKPASFRRVFEIAPTIDGGRIEAHLDQGLLSLRLPKAESVKPRKISVS